MTWRLGRKTYHWWIEGSLVDSLLQVAWNLIGRARLGRLKVTNHLVHAVKIQILLFLSGFDYVTVAAANNNRLASLHILELAFVDEDDVLVLVRLLLLQLRACDGWSHLLGRDQIFLRLLCLLDDRFDLHNCLSIDLRSGRRNHHELLL